jgi:hypothetical protein
LVPFSLRNGVVPPSGQVVGPSKCLGAVIAGEHNDGVICDSQIVELFEENTNVVVELCHASAVEAPIGDQVLVFFLQMRPDVHAGGVVPNEKRLASVFMRSRVSGPVSTTWVQTRTSDDLHAMSDLASIPAK